MLDDLALLTGPGAGALLAAALATVDERLLDWRVQHVDHRPGCGTTAAYAVRVRGAGGERARVMGAGTGLPSADVPGLVHLQEQGRDIVLWRFPFDPALPGLASATDERAVRGLLGSCGVEPAPAELRVRAYRPGRRAVVEVRTATLSLYVKVVPPSSVAGLHARHVLLRDAGLPVPRSLGGRPDGLLVLEALAGRSLRARLREGVVPEVSGRALLELLDRLPPALCALPPRPSWTDAVEHFAALTAAALPSEAGRCAGLAAQVRATTTGPAALDPVHGDLYETQLLLDGGRIAGLLDLDTAGPGRRADDLACMLAHLSVLAEVEAVHATGTRALADRWLAAFDAEVDPVDLRARVAGVVVALATGPHRVQAPGWARRTRVHLDLAQAWLDRARGR